MACDWQLPKNAVVGGYEKHDTLLYVGGFITKEGQSASGRIQPTHDCAYSSCADIEPPAKFCQISTHRNQNEKLQWVRTTGAILLRHAPNPNRLEVWVWVLSLGLGLGLGIEFGLGVGFGY